MKSGAIASLLCAMLGAFAVLPPAAAAADRVRLSDVKYVYLLSMGGGFDQYLANRISELGLFEVVTDPAKADAIFTDRLGEPFEQRLEELYPPPPAPPAEELAEKKKDGAEKEDAAGGADEAKAAESDTSKDSGRRVVVSSFGRGKGIVFLVDRRSREVMWSVFEKPQGTSPDALDKTAVAIAKRLKKASEPGK